MWNVAVNSIPMTDEERAKWPAEDEPCPRCGRPFGIWKQIRLPGGQVVHKRCLKKGEYDENLKEGGNHGK